MRSVVLIALLLELGLVAPVIAGQSDAESDVLKLHKEYEAAIARQDASVLERLLADDYTYTPSTGGFMDKARVVTTTKSGVFAVGSFRSDDLRVRVYGEAAVVTGRWIAEVTVGGRGSQGRDRRYLIVYARRNGHWQIVAEQRTAIAQ